MAKLPPQALPPNKRPKKPPPPFENMLPSGIMAKWRMPDPFTLVAFDGLIPDAVTSAVLELLKEEQYKTAESDPRKFVATAQQIKGMYGLAGAMLVEPKFDPSVEYGENGTLGRREIGMMDCAHLWWLFRLSTRRAPERAADPNDAERPADAGSNSAAVRDDASAGAED